MARLLEAAACQDPDTQRTHSLPVRTEIASGGFSPERRSVSCSARSHRSRLYRRFTLTSEMPSTSAASACAIP